MSARSGGPPGRGGWADDETREANTVIGFLLGAGVGYVLGAKAGRGRYDQIMRTYRRIADHPAVQGAAGIARAKLGKG
ncbi:hypothetical protein [Actinokineospora sp. NBRC 105648]|uniref:hypothetical protein n=1 Tax=Actinokineospora sp. NBRC 105648 TaxID=3032206 RepID=UPI0024A27FC5|nr:hypothetical protein [Actinokineospora sp. NBRC 105648]GLZ39580.1 hypothetical protein Acsp05_32040 [Actinokineospora sp. NBRC 105648]